MPWDNSDAGAATGVIEAQKAKAQHSSSLAPLNLLDLDLLRTPVALLDHHGGIVCTNRSWDQKAAAGQMTPGQRNYLDECKSATARDGPCGPKLGKGIARVLAGELPAFSETYPCVFDHQQHLFQVTIMQADVAGRAGALVMHSDVTLLQRDELTGLSNRALFEVQADYVLKRAKDANLETALLFIDLHGLKEINRALGRSAGDNAIRIIAERLSACLRKHDLIARLGGNAFGVILEPGTRPAAVLPIVCRLEAAIRKPILGVDDPIDADVGVGLYPGDGEKAMELHSVADMRMH